MHEDLSRFETDFNPNAPGVVQYRKVPCDDATGTDRITGTTRATPGNLAIFHFLHSPNRLVS